MIVLDLLGYGGTSRPLNLQDYGLKLVGQDVVDILDHEGVVEPVYGVGHDWGVTLLTRMEYYFPQRFAKLALLTCRLRSPGSGDGPRPGQRDDARHAGVLSVRLHQVLHGGS